MKVSQKILALMVAMAAGAAGAAGTTAGTVITNQANATFTDPATGVAVTAPVVSNTVSTTVTPVPNFTITPNDVGPGATQDQPYAPYDKTGAIPGSQQAFQYVVTNSGNTPVTVNLDKQNRTDTTVTGLAYYLDADGSGTLTAGDTLLTDTNGDGLVDTGSVAPDAVVKVLQVYTVPAAATPGAFYGADPVGTAKYDPAFKPGNAVPTTTSTTVVPNPGTGTGTLTDLDNFNRVLVYTPTVTLGPIDANSPGGTTPVAGGPTDGQTNPPSSATPGGTQPAYADPTAPGTLIGVAGSVQKAYPPADAETTTPDKVTFVNSITNSGTLTDSFFLLPPDLTGQPNVVVTYLDSAGNPLPLVTNPADGKQYPQVQNVAPGTTVNFRVVVTYPDTDGATPPVSPVIINVPIDSASDSDVTPNATATDSIYPPVLQFGDSTAALGTTATPAPDQVVSPGTAAGLTPANNGDSSAIFPMDLANVGGYDEAYKLSGSVVVPLVGGGSTTVLVKYYIDTNADGIPDTLLPVSGGVYTSPVVVAGTEQKVWAVVDIPTNAQATVANGTSTPLLVSQQAVGVTSGIIRKDNNDTVSIAPVGTVALTKSVDKPSAKPGQDLTYTIVAKNGYNTTVKNFIMRESDGGPTNVFANSVFKSVFAAPIAPATGTVLYRFNGPTGTTPFGWQASATPAIPLANVTSVEVALDTDANGIIDTNDTIPANGQLTETLVVTIK